MDKISFKISKDNVAMCYLDISKDQVKKISEFDLFELENLKETVYELFLNLIVDRVRL
jgi:hypothetical protein